MGWKSLTMEAFVHMAAPNHTNLAKVFEIKIYLQNLQDCKFFVLRLCFFYKKISKLMNLQNDNKLTGGTFFFFASQGTIGIKDRM